ncbi:MAG: hypothetical protein PWR18_948 [Synergistales bacterium]|nr:hypothetical protein [Synergistales bacterium]
MLHAFVKGKVSFDICEDSLTAAVISRMAYLPSEMIWRLIRGNEDFLPTFSGVLENIEFWPIWSSLDQRSYCEPDVILEFENIDVIVEAKREDTYLQNYEQLANELRYYFAQREGSKKPVLLWALGGMGRQVEKISEYSRLSSPGNSVYFAATSWLQLFNRIKKLERFLRHKIQTNDDISSHPYCFESGYFLRIINDIIMALKKHGIQEWFFLNETHKLSCHLSVNAASLTYYCDNRDAHFTGTSSRRIFLNELPTDISIEFGAHLLNLNNEG